MGTVIVMMALGVIVALIVRSLIRDKKNGKFSCGGDCSHCKGCHVTVHTHDTHSAAGRGENV